MTSRLEHQIRGLIRQQFPGYTVEYNTRPEWLMSEEGQRLELDIYLPEVKIAIEVQGAQHYVYTPHFHPHPDDFDKQLQRDRAKRHICQHLQITLIEVASFADYEAAKAVIHKALLADQTQILTNYILHKVSQTVLNIINLTINLEHLRKGIAPSPTARRRNTSVEELTRRLEENRELLRYVSIRAIQDFHNLSVFHNTRGRFAMYQRRKQGLFISTRRFGSKRKGVWGNMRRWA